MINLNCLRRISAPADKGLGGKAIGHPVHRADASKRSTAATASGRPARAR
jgi:hypothetical protein